MSKQSRRNFERLALVSAMVAVFGYLAGILTAPKSGKDTREDIKEAGNKSKAEAEKDLKKLNIELNDLIRQAKDKSSKASDKTKQEAKEKLAKAVETKEKLREIARAIHSGDSTDHDLKSAVSSANSAIEHLKEYLKK